MAIVVPQVLLSAVQPFNFYVGTETPEGSMTFPDDGLSDFARRTLKVQVITLLGLISGGIGIAIAHGERE